MTRRSLLLVVAALAVVATGCVGNPAGPAPATSGSPGSSPESPASPASPSVDGTPYPDTTAAWPDGPKERPDRPDALTGDSLREFVRTHEYRYVYNELWYSNRSDVSLECEVDDVGRTGAGHEVTVSCTGSSNTEMTPEPGGTPVEMHADWFTQTYTYYVDEDSLVRQRAE